MRYLSFDLEATGLNEDDYIIEFAMIPFCTKKGQLEDSLASEIIVHCPSFTSLKPRLDPWVIEHNQTLIERSHKKGISLDQFKQELENYLKSDLVREYFNNEKVVLFGKSMNAIDLPFMARDLSWKFMRQYFDHRTMDLTSVAMALIDLKLIPAECITGSGLMKHLNMGEVKHTALEDAKNTALMYLSMLKMFTKD